MRPSSRRMSARSQRNSPTISPAKRQEETGEGAENRPELGKGFHETSGTGGAHASGDYTPSLPARNAPRRGAKKGGPPGGGPPVGPRKGEGSEAELDAGHEGIASFR